MSKVEDLKTAVSVVASNAQNTANSLSGYKAKLSDQIGEIQELIGGTATQTDREVIASLSAAVRSAEETVNSLLDAARKASAYTNQI
ncbi:hypothetical protein APR04_006005 [Promicromonospora umidemergens]|uniref:Type VII secretion system (Wss) protein ESAT-6 n=3 Tax=Promicromonospora TaxID=43676 RepID=A0ABW4V912_9MICO|nr:hypothetical protein [Promicromonospora umidemergens]MCP2287058.1 hypothetical protein [Promicromonospora umidemergens]